MEVIKKKPIPFYEEGKESDHLFGKDSTVTNESDTEFEMYKDGSYVMMVTLNLMRQSAI